MARQAWAWTDLQLERAENVQEVVKELKPYWALTLRQIYYQLVSKGHIENNKSAYNALSKLVKWMRINGRIPWDALEDRSRTLGRKRGYRNTKEFLEQELKTMFKGYSRCRVQTQPKYIEVWVEKDALSQIFHKVVYPFCIRSTAVRGYSSVTFLADYYVRATEAIMQGKKPVVLYFGDLDPSGVQMLEASIETLEDELDLYDVEFKRIGLNPAHIKKYDLPADPSAIKMSDPRYDAYVRRYGEVAVELDAVHPAELEKMIRDAIMEELNWDEYMNEWSIGNNDEKEMKALRDKVIKLLQDEVPELFVE
jgi:hypothetical protein